MSGVRIHVKLWFVVFGLMSLLVFGLLVIRHQSSQGVGAVLRSRQQEAQSMVDKVLAIHGGGLEMLALDYTFWDEMVQFVDSADPTWAEENIIPSLETFDTQVVWVLRPDFSRVWFGADPQGVLPGQLPVSKETLADLFREQRLIHFFVASQAGLVEIRGATIHPTADLDRLSDPHGYFIVGRIWDDERLTAVAHAVGGEVRIQDGEEALERREPEAQGADDLVTYHDLQSWDGRTLATLTVETPSPMIPMFLRAANTSVALSSGLALAMVLIVAWILLVWLARPMRSLGRSLVTGDLQHLGHLRDQTTEFGEMARVITDFFQQQEAILAAAVEQKRLTEQILAAERRLDSIIRAIPDVVYRLDPDGLISFVSESVTTYGYDPSELIGRDVLDLIHPDDREKARLHAQERRTGDRATHEYEIRMLPKGADAVPFENRAASLTPYPVVLLDAEGIYSAQQLQSSDFMGTQGLLRDITERRREEAHRRELEDRLRQAEKVEALAVMAGGIAHDFSNILMGVTGYAELALGEIPNESPTRPKVERILQQAQRAVGLTRQMLAYSGHGIAIRESIDLRDVVQGALAEASPFVPEGVTLAQDLAQDLPPVAGDAAQLRQAVVALLANCVEALPDSRGTVTVRASVSPVEREQLADSYIDDGLPPGPYISLEVSDTGTGMDTDTHARMFDPFFSSKFPGRGLGLAVVLGVVRGHGGAVSVDTQPGAGTTVRILLPVAERDVVAPEP